jgi:hypothetical protein
MIHPPALCAAFFQQEQIMSITQRLLGGASALLILVGSAGAQDVSAVAARPVTPSVAATPFAVTPMPPRLAPASEASAVLVEVSRDEAARAAVAVAAQRARGQGSTLMIVGGAAVVTGLLLDEGVITFVGAAVWLYGLYVYLR